MTDTINDSKFIILCKDFELTEALKIYAINKLQALNKYFTHHDQNSIKYNLRLGKTSQSHNHGKIYYAELTIHTPDKNYGAEIIAEDTYTAIDLLKAELSQNIAHYKDKLRTLNKKDAQKFKEQLHTLTDEVVIDEDEIINNIH